MLAHERYKRCGTEKSREETVSHRRVQTFPCTASVCPPPLVSQFSRPPPYRHNPLSPATMNLFRSTKKHKASTIAVHSILATVDPGVRASPESSTPVTHRSAKVAEQAQNHPPAGGLRDRHGAARRGKQQHIISTVALHEVFGKRWREANQ